MNWLTKALSVMRHAPARPFFTQLLKRTRFDYRKEVGDCLDSSVVTAPVMWVQRALPEAVLVVSQRDRLGNVTELLDHPMLALIQTPNPFYGDIALWMATIMSFLIDGNAYWIIVRNGANVPVELWYVPWWLIEPRWPLDGSAFLSHYVYSPGGGVEPQVLDPTDVVHFRYGINPRNLRKGLSPLDGVIREIFVDLESSNFVASLLRNMGVPGVVISPKGGAMPAPEDVEATKTWFKQAFGGDNRGGPLVMGAPTDVQPYGFNPQQLNLGEGRDVSEERVCACLGIPVAVVGFGSGLQQTKVGATMEEMRKLGWTNGVLPIARMLADELQRSLLGQFGKTVAGTRVGWDTREVLALQEDEDKRTDRWNKKLAAGGVTLREYRVGIGEPVDKSHDIYLRPINVIEVPVGAAPAQALPVPAKGVKDNVQPSASAIKRGLAYVNGAAGVQRAWQKSFQKALTGFFTALGKAAADAAAPLLATDPSLPKAQKDDGPTPADQALVAMILDKLGIPAWQSQMSGLYQGQYLEVAKALQDMAGQAGLGASLPDHVAQAIVAAGGRRAGLVDIDTQTKDALFKALAQGRAAGEGATALAARIAEMVGGGPAVDAQARGRRIARTEVGYAKNISTIERGQAAGVTQYMVFDGRLGPGRSMPSHIARNGSVVSAQAALAMADSEHPNGTLSLAPYFGEDT